MKKLFIFTISLLMVIGSSFGQETAKDVKKTNQYDVLNELYAEYGMGSLYFYLSQNQRSSWSFTNIGTFILGYTRSLNKLIGVGFELGLTPMNATYNGTSTSSDKSETHYYIQALARIRFQYLNKPSFGIYSGIGIGVTQHYYNITDYKNNIKDHQELLPAGQLTLLGFRVGRGAAFAGEFGLGTLSILNLGFSYKFGN